ncbi:MAG: copper amine oxidase N-terminal domain-containing protein [Dysosmobacter sp.]|nr:copper amine oxidase N-terminal domain-containing protein [Dysosmobacter sp.]
MKKFCALLLSLALAAALALPAAAQEVPVSGAKAVTMVPLRAVAEALGYTVAWDGSLPGARLTLGDREAVLVLGMGYATLLDHGAGGDPVMGTSLPMDAAPAMLEKGVMYVPADFFNDLMGGPCVTVSGSGDISVELDDVPAGGTAQLPNPQHQHNTVEALEAAVGFPVPVPAAPAGFAFTLIQDIGGTLAELRWSDEVQELTYRVSRGGSDNSGDYTVYPASGTLTVKDASVQWRGDEGGIRVALWTREGFSFSLRASDGLTERQVRQMAESVL